MVRVRVRVRVRVTVRVRVRAYRDHNRTFCRRVTHLGHAGSAWVHQRMAHSTCSARWELGARSVYV